MKKILADVKSYMKQILKNFRDIGSQAAHPMHLATEPMTEKIQQTRCDRHTHTMYNLLNLYNVKHNIIIICFIAMY